MNYVVFDIETANWLGENGISDLKDLNVALVGTYESATDSYDSFLEADLPRLWQLFERAELLVGYNSDHFDIPILNKYYPGDLSKIKSLDLLKEVHASAGRRLKLDSLAEATLGEKKIASGMQSLEWWRKGEVEKVREYCLKDVEITRKIMDYALKHGVVKYKDFGALRDVKLDTSNWLSANSAPLTKTLGF